MPVKSPEDLRKLIDLVGVKGARAALRADKSVPVATLSALLSGTPATLPRRPTRNELIELALGPYEHTIQKSVAELSVMRVEDLENYLDLTDCSRGELMIYLDSAKIPYSGGATRPELIKEAAVGIARLGLFEKITAHPRSG